ncbi:MAG: oligoribonuclease [Dehalococcoidia bacterium]|jgi:oligoribonuclease|nr:oligoribonuclease [Dehalococcoidia bacterium]
MPKNTNLFWVDLEMTGLGDDQVIVEIASLVTDADLNVLAEGPELAIHRTPEEMARMEKWPAEQHKKSGLLDRIEASKIGVAEAERQTLNFLKKWAEKGKAPLCGNSIWVDRRFLHREMPMLEGYLHYRMIDVSSIKELVGRWYPKDFRPPDKKGTHLAMDDVRESVGELAWYRANVFRAAAERAGAPPSS